ncbi:uroporphyrinogen-III C-methyltransferase [Shewanella intestini]|uniref:Uroporphyrinogen-III methylase n=1 Tax=Shewanella intestini TaxID=2017544 RepID=A0ABS5I6G5_9GAMM|nr:MULTISPECIES: uroporphyrinogen-III C-methyltransferase [Shewanella]MBR9729602.1 uroporphyrinogen-III methylase [Shewanella intestini]MRG37670.1 uroporphyrinogen-III methylase [Shewanella sp. XMDDZSB0408]
MDNNKPQSPLSTDIDEKLATPAVEANDATEKTSETVDESPTSPSNLSAIDNQKLSTHFGVKLTLVLVFLLSITAIAACAWIWYTLQQQADTHQHAQQQLSSQTTQAQQKQQALSSALSQTQQRLKTLESLQQNDTKAYEQLNQLQQQTKKMQERVSVLANRSPNHWMASEAEYLVRMAGRKLWLEKDPLTATGLLEAADERIKSMRDPALMPLRQALVNDIKATKSIKSTDVVGTVYTLDALIAQLDELPLNRAKAQAGEDTSKTVITDSLSDWQANLAKTWQEITESFITIRKRTTDLEPLLAPDQQWYLVENIRNKLLQAQLAVYNYDQVNYRQSIEFATTWIKQYFDLEDKGTQDAIESLNALKTLSIENTTHHKFKSTKMLQQLITYGELIPNEDSAL